MPTPAAHVKRLPSQTRSDKCIGEDVEPPCGRRRHHREGLVALRVVCRRVRSHIHSKNEDTVVTAVMGLVLVARRVVFDDGVEK